MNLHRMEKAAAALLGISVFAVTAGATSAYLTSCPEQLENIISTGFLGIELKEPGWNAEKAKYLLPRSTVVKNPTLENTGNTPAWMFAKVSIPVRNIKLVEEETRRKTEKKKTELFSFQLLSGWEQISREVREENVEYVFGYPHIIAPGEQTPALFEEITMVNYLEGELDSREVLEIPVDAAAIQSNVCALDTPLASIYEIYLKQEAAGMQEGDEI